MEVSGWLDAAKIVIEDCMGIQAGEKVLLVIGEGIEQEDGMADFYKALKEELHRRQYDLCILSYFASAEEPVPRMLEDVCAEADVIITLYVPGLLHSDAFPRIQKKRKQNSRLVLLPDESARGYLERNMPKTKKEFYEIADITGRVGKKFLDKPHQIHLTGENGTDLRFSIGTLQANVLTGIGTVPGVSMLLPAGTLSIGVDEGSAEGILVADYCNALNRNPGEGKIVFEIHDGYAEKITGDGVADNYRKAAAKYQNPAKEKFCIAEFGLGFTKGADAAAFYTEGENMYGATHIGIGSNGSFGGNVMIDGWHTDFILPDLAVEVDGELIVKDGEYFV